MCTIRSLRIMELRRLQELQEQLQSAVRQLQHQGIPIGRLQ